MENDIRNLSTVAKGRNIAYWITTITLAFELGMGGIWDIFRISFVRGIISHLGYPAYFLTIIGIWKIPGAIALFNRRFKWLREWAYAGAIFIYTGAVTSHLIKGDFTGSISPIIFSGITFASWILKPSSGRDFKSPSVYFSKGYFLYWVATLLLAIECIAGGIMGALQLSPFIGIIKHLGYPAYLMTILGIWYALAGIAILVPNFPRLKEWAYAGLIFNYTGAIASHLAIGDSVIMLLGPLFFMGLVILSWILRPESRRTS